MRENPIASPIHVTPQDVACRKLTRPKKTQTASHPKFNLVSKIFTMIEQLSERGRAASPACLLSIDGIECLVHKLAENSEEVHPLRYPHCETQIVVHVRKGSNDVDDQTGQGNQVRCDTL